MKGYINSILVPVDGSENSARAARFGIQLAATLQVPVILFYVFPAASVELVGMAGISRQEIDEAAQSCGQRALDEVRLALDADMQQRFQQAITIGDPAEEIIARTEADPATMVVMGRRGRSPLKSLVLGSVSDKVLRYAAAPVTVVN
ncbi:MAG: universal stress protein [Gammaproteobacteria bacterium]|jgi:nucleotide-binding universal stress UspA family protein